MAVKLCSVFVNEKNLTEKCHYTPNPRNSVIVLNCILKLRQISKMGERESGGEGYRRERGWGGGGGREEGGGAQKVAFLGFGILPLLIILLPMAQMKNILF